MGLYRRHDIRAQEGYSFVDHDTPIHFWALSLHDPGPEDGTSRYMIGLRRRRPIEEIRGALQGVFTSKVYVELHKLLIPTLGYKRFTYYVSLGEAHPWQTIIEKTLEALE